MGKKVETLGAGEILLTSMDRDGTQKGFDVELTKRISEQVNIPVIASGGIGTLDHFSKESKKEVPQHFWQLQCFILENFQ